MRGGRITKRTMIGRVQTILEDINLLSPQTHTGKKLTTLAGFVFLDNSKGSKRSDRPAPSDRKPGFIATMRKRFRSMTEHNTPTVMDLTMDNALNIFPGIGELNEGHTLRHPAKLQEWQSRTTNQGSKIIKLSGHRNVTRIQDIPQLSPTMTTVRVEIVPSSRAQKGICGPRNAGACKCSFDTLELNGQSSWVGCSHVNTQQLWQY